ncbi:MAG: hypothetical protein KF872_09070 [Chitinophagales bacterium]|nr:hypothetical protein [Chitinophagales bacterium]
MALEEELLKQLSEDLSVCREYLRQVSNAMRKGDVSKYPIFIAHRDETDLGVPIIHRAEMDLYWSFSASHLEDLVNRKIVLLEKVEDFKKAYRDPAAFMCILVIDAEEGNFVFLPFEKTNLPPNSQPQLN